jgi:hypothetical protein
MQPERKGLLADRGLAWPGLADEILNDDVGQERREIAGVFNVRRVGELPGAGCSCLRVNTTPAS